MEFEWGEGKDTANRAKHGVSLAEAAHLEWEGGQTRPDLRRDFGEARTEILALLGNRLHQCVFTMREGAIRVISLRKANKREERRYEQARPK